LTGLITPGMTCVTVNYAARNNASWVIKPPFCH